jgi:hypothetical protein
MAGGLFQMGKNIFWEDKTVAHTNIGVNIKFDVNRLVEYFGNIIKNSIEYAGKKQAEKKQQQQTANAIFRAAAKEIYTNLAILSEQNYDVIKTQAINSAPIKNIVKSLETTYQAQCETYIKQYAQLKKKEKAIIIDKISLVQFKIDKLRTLTKKTKNELESLNHQFRPAVRLKNIRNIYLEIKDKLK